MSMPVFVLFSRSLALDGRKFLTYLARMLLVLIIIFSLLSAQATSGAMGAPGLSFFHGAVWTTWLFISLAGVVLFSSVISEEKEEMTLGLLKMTGLNPVSILLGKSASRVLGGIFLLLAQFPFTLLAITLGGVSLGQVIAAYCMLLSYLVFLGGLALFCSVSCRRTASAAGLTLLLLLVFFLLPWLGQMMLDGAASVGWISPTGGFHVACTTLFQWMRDASPITRIETIMQTGFAESPIGFQVLSNLGVGVFFFLVSWLTFERFTREQKTAAPARILLFRRTSLFAPVGVGRAWSRPLIWKEFHFDTGGKVMLGVKAALLAVTFAVIAHFIWPARISRPDVEQLGTVMMVVSLVLAVVELIFHAGRTFNKEHKWQTLSSLMLLPITPQRLVYHKLAGCLLALTPYLAFFCVGAILSPQDFLTGLKGILGSPAGWMGILQVVLILHLAAYMSLVVRYGGVALALLIAYVGNTLTFPLFFFSFGNVTVFLIMQSLVLLFFTVLLHVQIMRRLVRKAGE